MVALMQDLADADEAYEDFWVWSFGQKRVWDWQHQPAVIRVRRYLELSLSFDLDGLQAQGAWWFADRSQIERFRHAVDETDSGEQLTTVVHALRAAGFGITGDVMKRVPRGYDPEHPRAELLKHRSLLAQQLLGCDEWLHTPAVVDRVLEAFHDLGPMMSWFTSHVSMSPDSA